MKTSCDSAGRIPVVDLNCLEHTNSKMMEDITQQLDTALRSHSCLYMTNTGVSHKTVQDVFDTSKKFFDLHETTKLLYERGKSHDSDHLGYYRSTKEAFRERYDFGLKFEDFGKLPEKHVAGITSAIAEFASGMTSVSKFLFTRIGNALKFENEDELIQHHRGTLDQNSTVPTKAHLSSICYNGIETVDTNGGTVEFLMGKHTDFSSMTLLCSNAPGLQVQLPDGSGTWLDVIPETGGIFLHVGDLLDYWTGGHYPATVHRVKHFEGDSSGRQSIAYFLHPDADATVAPLIDTPMKEAYPPIRAGEYFEQKMKSRKVAAAYGNFENDPYAMTFTPPSA